MTLLLLSGIFGLALVAWSLYLLFRKSSTDPDTLHVSYPQAQVTIGAQTFRAAVADTITKRAQGLSGRKALAADEAMLFIFHIPMRRSFWMKNMNFPLDIIWIREGRIADISENVAAPGSSVNTSSLPRITPRVAVDAALEVNAGLATKYGWKKGDNVYFNYEKNRN